MSTGRVLAARPVISSQESTVYDRSTIRTASGLAAALLLAACSSGGDSAAKRPDTVGTKTAAATPPPCTTGTAELTLPAGFCATIFADSIIPGRHVAVASNGDVYVTLEGTKPAAEKQMSGAAKAEPKPASFVALRDTNHDGRADVIKHIGSLGNTGIALANGFLYVDEGKQIVRYARSDTALSPEGKREVVVSGLPMDGGHRARSIAIGGDGALYVVVGSKTKSCQKNDRDN